MANTYQVTCTKKDGPDTDRRFDALGGPTWTGTQDQVLGWIDQGHKFWTSVNGKSVWVTTDVHPVSRRRYCKTEGDNYPLNNLLKLPDCP